MIIVFAHCIIGNIVGATTSGSGILYYLLLPYSFISGLSAFAGWDLMSLLMELGSIVVMTLVFYPLGLLLKKDPAPDKAGDPGPK